MMADNPPGHIHPHHDDHYHGKPLIRFEGASFHYPHGPALEDISLQIADGEFIGVIGPNGSGKTTLLRAILGLMPPTRGSLQIFDCACEELQCYHRARIGYLPQREAVDPNFPITVEETVLMGRSGVIGLFRRPTKTDRAIVQQALEDVGMAEFSDRPLGALSGGQQQRVFIARALAQHPQILLLDEPTTGIDTPTQHAMLDLIQHLHRDLHLTIILVSHDINLIAPLADRIALLKTRLYAIGPAKEVLNAATLAQVYGPEAVKTVSGHVMIADHHHAR
jgi:ABC-type Mn2+/Zn2+ transport system ATPase subunit